MLVGLTHKYDGYLDMTTTAPTTETVRLWTMKDFKVTRQIPSGWYRSMKIKKQFDCRNNRSRLLSSKYYTGQTAQGTRQWSRVIPGSDGEAEWKIACRKA